MTGFAHPYILFLLILLGAVIIYAWRKPSPSLRVPSIRPFKLASEGSLPINLRKLIPFTLFALAGVLIVIALASPREGTEEIRRRAEGIDIMIAIDLSGSMKAIDIPGSIRTENQLESALRAGLLKERIEIAKEEIAKFIKARPNDRIGLVAFAPLPYVVCPPTLDHGWLTANLERLESGSIGDATGIAGPIASSVQRLKDSDSKRRIIVLFTDGRNNVAAKVTPRQAAKLADTFNVSVYTVGIGSKNAFVKQNSLFGQSFVPLRGEFDEKLLEDIASTSGGRYYRAADAEGMAKALSEIDKLEKTNVEQSVTINWRELYPPLCIAAASLIMLALLLENTFLISIP